MKQTAFIFIGFLFILAKGYAQPNLPIKEKGYPFIRNYDNTEYHAASQNWGGLSDSIGVLHFANNQGLLSFDGASWSMLRLESKEGIKCLTQDDKGTIYFGTNGAFGYLQPDSVGNLSFVLLKEITFSGTSQLGTVLDVTAVNEKIFFLTVDQLYVYDRDTEEIQKIDGDHFHRPFKHQGTYYVVTSDGVLFYQKNELHQISGSAAYAKSGLFLLDMEGELMIYSHEQQLAFLYDGKKLRQTTFGPDLSEIPYILFLHRTGGHIVVGTGTSGAYVFNEAGKLELRLNTSTGILSDGVNDCFLDGYNDLWLSTNNGLSKVEWSSAYSLLDKRNGLLESTIITHRFGDDLYTCTYGGLYKSRWNNTGDVSFERLNNDHRSFWYFLPDGENQLVTHGDGVSQVINDKILTISKNESVGYAMDFTEDKQSILVGTRYDFYVLKKKNESWYVHSRIKNFRQLSDFMVCIRGNEFWMSNSGSGVFLLKLNPAMDSLLVKAYGTDSGLPSLYDNRVFRFNGDVVFATANGLYDYREETDRFEKNIELSNHMENGSVFRFAQGSSGQIWFDGATDKSFRGVLFPISGGYQKVLMPEKKLGKFNYEHINPIDSSNILVSNTYGLLHIDPTIPLSKDYSYSTIITGVTSLANDSLIAGTYAARKNRVFDADLNSFRFSFSAACYDEPEKLEYHWRLIGYENEWSITKNEITKDYTNLSSGEYTFEVRGVNVYDVLGKPARFSFTILSPWYAQWWMIVIYSLIFIGFLVGLVKLNSIRLRNENVKLERIIQDRIKEIREQKNIIETQAIGLEKALKERESLLKEIHHRVKNNLQIIASLLYLQSGKFENEDFKKVLEEGQGRVRSMALIHQKLYENDDLKSIPFGEYLTELLSEIKASFGQDMEKVRLNIEADDIRFDVETAIPLGLIVNELATNAFKYAFEGMNEGMFSISLKKEHDQFVLSISDDGKGLPDGIDIRKTKSLGLRLVKMLSVQLEGKYEIASSAGTHFNLKFAA